VAAIFWNADSWNTNKVIITTTSGTTASAGSVVYFNGAQFNGVQSEITPPPPDEPHIIQELI
jgi:hypothetical protein